MSLRTLKRGGSRAKLRFDAVTVDYEQVGPGHLALHLIVESPRRELACVHVRLDRDGLDVSIERDGIYKALLYVAPGQPNASGEFGRGYAYAICSMVLAGQQIPWERDL